jgi:DNA topoisomerase III
VGILNNLKKYAKEATDIVLWLDCDREGEAIAYDVLEACNLTNNNRAKVHRAQFSAATKSDIENAYNNLIKLDPNLKDAV